MCIIRRKIEKREPWILNLPNTFGLYQEDTIIKGCKWCYWCLVAWNLKYRPWWTYSLVPSLTVPQSSGLFLLGHMKSLVYETPVNSAEDIVIIIVVTADKLTSPKGCSSRSFVCIKCATTRVVGSLNTCGEFKSAE